MQKETKRTRVLITDPGLGYGHPTFAYALEVHAQSQLSSSVEAEVLTMKDGGNSLLTRTAIAISEALYREGSQGSLRTHVYERLRRTNSASEAGFPNRLLTGPLESTLQNWDGLVIATHHLTAQACQSWKAENGAGRLFVIQGDVHASAGYEIPLADKIFVPVEDPVSPLHHRGIPKQKVCEVGFLVHPLLLGATEKRDLAVCREQLTKGPLRLGFFLSGAFPGPHKNTIRACLASCQGLLTRGLARVTIVPMEDAAFGSSIERFARSQLGLTTCFDSDTAPDESWQVRVVQPQGTKRDVIHHSHVIAGQIDIFVSMANERTWPLAMATFAPRMQIGASRQNWHWLDQNGLVATIHDPGRFGEMVQDLMTDGSRGWWGQLQRRLEELPTNGVANAWKEILSSG
jgi:hypothetical protein